MSEQKRPYIEIEHFSFYYPERTEKVLDDLTLTVEQGEFLVLCGPSGCGKSTLLRQLKTVLAPHGRRLGSIHFEGRPLEELDQREQSAGIGFVQQDPENQIVTDKVWHELAFGLESLGYDTPTIRRRVAEMASFFGIQTWFYKNVTELSGGQKQLLNLASIMAMQPSVLILDEPTSQLDPIAAADFLATLGKINRELGTTVVLTEHRLEDAFPLASRVAVMDRGRLLCTGSPAEVGAILRGAGHSMFLAMPTPMRIWASAPDAGGHCPVTVREGRDWLTGFADGHPLGELPAESRHVYPDEPAITAEGLWFKYEKELPDVVKGLSLTVRRGEFLALLGGNGTGKTTSLKLLSGLQKPYRGEVKLVGRVGVLPQNPQALFVKKSVREDLIEILKGRAFSRKAQEERIAWAVRLCRLEELLDRHPYDLSGGEQQRAALAKVLLLGPEILLLDEPTKGLDAEFKQTFAEILQTLLRQEVALLMVSHDIEFCARYAHPVFRRLHRHGGPAAGFFLRQQLLHDLGQPHGPWPAPGGSDSGGRHTGLRRDAPACAGTPGSQGAAPGAGGVRRVLQTKTADLVAQAGRGADRSYGLPPVPVLHEHHRFDQIDHRRRYDRAGKPSNVSVCALYSLVVPVCCLHYAPVPPEGLCPPGAQSQAEAG